MIWGKIIDFFLKNLFENASKRKKQNDKQLCETNDRIRYSYSETQYTLIIIIEAVDIALEIR